MLQSSVNAISAYSVIQLFERDQLKISDAVITFGVSLVLLSANMSAHLNSTRKSIALIRATTPACKILLGGDVFDGVPDLAVSLGADAYSSELSDAVAAGNRLCND